MPAKARIELTAKDKTKAAFQSAQRSMNGFRSAAIGLGSVLTAGLFARATTSALDFADGIDKAAQAAGVSAEFLQEFRFAGEQVGVTVNQVDEGLRRFTRRMGEFANSGGGPAAKAFEQFNVQVRDSNGEVRSAEDVLGDFISALEDVDSAAQRGAVAAQIFGDDAGPKLRLLLDQGVTGIERLKQEANDIGAVLSDEVIANSVEAKDELAKLSNVLSVQFATALSELSPLLTSAASKFVELASAARKIFDRSSDPIAQYERQIKSLQETVKEGRDDLNSPFFFGDVTEKEEEIARAEADIRTLTEAVRLLKKEQAKPVETGSDPVSLTPEIDNKKLEEQSKQAQKLFNETRTPAEKLSIQIEELNGLFESGAIDFDVYSRAVFSAQDAFDGLSTKAKEVADETKKAGDETKEISDAARDLGFTFSSAFEDAVIEGKGLRDVLQGIADDITRIVLRRAITEPLAAGITQSINPFVPQFASGTSFAPGGLSLVGEFGPELVNLPRGSRVHPNAGGVEVNVYNSSNAQAEVTRSNDSTGKEIIEVVIAEVDRRIAHGGSTSQAMQQRFGGLRPNMIGRT